MNETELRIGNHITFMNKHNPIVIEGIREGMIYANGDWDVIEAHDPIPLDKSWLVKFGAKEHPVVGCPTEWQIFIDELGVELNWDAETGCVAFINNSNESISLDHIKYVHQLQNIYYDLKGEELIISQS